MVSRRAFAAFRAALLVLLALAFVGCGGDGDRSGVADTDGDVYPGASEEMRANLAKYTAFTLTTDVGALTDNERKMIPLLIEAADEMDAVFWRQSFGDKDALLSSIDDPATRRFAEINYGPWDRLDGDRPFIDGYGVQPKGAQFYPEDMTVEEFERAASTSPERGEALRSLYTLVRRDASGDLVTVPYHEAYPERTARAAAKLREAATYADDPGLKRYLELRADALETSEFRQSDFAWLEMKNNVVDFVVGPIEVYEDELFGYKAAHEAYVLVKDREWSRRLDRYASLLPELQRGLPVPESYKSEEPGTDSELNAYDVVYYAGHSNAGSKTIAINLPNDEIVQLEKGTRRLQLKNAMRAKFDRILMPIAGKLVAEDQRAHVKFDAFFANVMFHEVAHGLGIKNTIDGSSTVSAALRERSSDVEEAKADVLGLYMVSELLESGELEGTELRDHYVTFVAGIFRSIRFGASSAHGRANLAQLRFLSDRGAFVRDETTGTYRVDFDAMDAAVAALAEEILTLQGDGDRERATRFIGPDAGMPPQLEADLESLSEAGIPVDVVFEQGADVLGLGG